MEAYELILLSVRLYVSPKFFVFYSVHVISQLVLPSRAVIFFNSLFCTSDITSSWWTGSSPLRRDFILVYPPRSLVKAINS
jgi:hypothetical protein